MTPTHFALSTSFALGLTGLAFHRTHLLSALLCLESMMLCLYITFSMWTLKLNTFIFSSSPMMLLAFSACEASAGLALLVATSRTHGNDNLKTLNILQC